jgi:hypothetical protein
VGARPTHTLRISFITEFTTFYLFLPPIDTQSVPFDYVDCGLA